jgi:hypothetical protein
MRKRKIAIPTARALRVRTDRIAELNVSVIVQSGLALWMQSRIEPVALGGGEDTFSEGLPHHRQNTSSTADTTTTSNIAPRSWGGTTAPNKF